MNINENTYKQFQEFYITKFIFHNLIWKYKH